MGYFNSKSMANKIIYLTEIQEDLELFRIRLITNDMMISIIALVKQEDLYIKNTILIIHKNY